MVPLMPQPVPPLVPPGAEFVLGESPFHAKGVLYIGTQSFFEENLRGGVAELYDDISEPELREFISQRFLPSGWYDVMPVPALIAYEARALRMELPEYLRHRTRWQAQRDLRGVYRWILKLASPGMVATRLPKIMTQMFDFAEADVTRSTDEEVTVQMKGIPEVLQEWFLNALGIYAETALKLAGAQSVETAIDQSTLTARRAGIDLHRLDLRLHWH